jgi:AraC-like DNA-binding protein
MVHLFNPNPPLSKYVENFLAMSFHFEQEVQQLVSARGVPMLVFPFNSPPKTSLKHGFTGHAYPHETMWEPALLGTNSEFTVCKFEGNVNFVMVMLKPTGAYHFLRDGIKELSNAVATFQELQVEKYFSELQGRLWGIRQPAEVVHMIQLHLCRYFELKNREDVGDFSPVLAYMMRNPSKLTVHSLSKKFKCTERWIEKQCALQTGLSPKSWLRTIRHRAAANYWINNPHASWMEIVARFDYTDQSHLIRDFRHFSGNPPAQHFSMYREAEVGLQQHKVGLSSMIEADS